MIGHPLKKFGFVFCFVFALICLMFVEQEVQHVYRFCLIWFDLFSPICFVFFVLFTCFSYPESKEIWLKRSINERHCYVTSKQNVQQRKFLTSWFLICNFLKSCLISVFFKFDFLTWFFDIFFVFVLDSFAFWVGIVTLNLWTFFGSSMLSSVRFSKISQFIIKISMKKIARVFSFSLLFGWRKNVAQI